MNKKINISQAASKISVMLVYFLFFAVQLRFQYQPTIVEFVGNGTVNQAAYTQSKVQQKTIKSSASIRLNKRYHHEAVIIIDGFLKYGLANYPNSVKNYYPVSSFIPNKLFTTHFLRGPPNNV